MNEWTEYQRPAPQFEQIVPAAPVETPELPDLDEMARTLDDMKVEAAVDAERIRPGLNGFLAFVVVTGFTYLAEFVLQHGTDAFSALIHTSPIAVPAQTGVALGAGLVVAVTVAVGGHLATRRAQRAVAEFEQRLIALGGTPLPERGLALSARKRQARSR